MTTRSWWHNVAIANVYDCLEIIKKKSTIGKKRSTIIFCMCCNKNMLIFKNTGATIDNLLPLHLFIHYLIYIYNIFFKYFDLNSTLL